MDSDDHKLECMCLADGYCPRHNMTKDAHQHTLCRTRGYLPAFDFHFGIHSEPKPPHAPLPPCIYRRDTLGTIMTPVGQLAVLGCTKHSETTGPECESCTDRCETHPEGRTTPSILDHLPPAPKGRPVRTWAVGMTTAPRTQETFSKSIRSLITGGFNRVHVFAEPESPIPDDLRNLPITQREKTLRAWPNFYYGLIELMDRYPAADAYLMAQDDVEFWTGEDGLTLREFLERSLWPSDDVGAVSIYCSAAYHKGTAGWYALDRSWVWGAQCFIFPRASLAHFLSTTARQWTEAGETHKVDVAVGKWASAHKRPMWYCSPSLCKHIGKTTTVWDKPQALAGRRSERRFIGDVLR